MEQLSLANESFVSVTIHELQNEANCVPYCQQEDKKYQQKEVLDQLSGQLETLIEKRDRWSKIRPPVQRYNQGLEALDRITHQKANFLMPTAKKSLRKRHRETQLEGFRAVNEWMRWLQDTKEEESLTRALITEPMLSSEALLRTKVSVADQNHEISLMMNSHESTEQAPIAIEGNIDHTNQQEAQTTDSGNPNVTSVSVLSPQKLDHLPNEPENTLGSLSKRPSSNHSSRSSRKRLEMEAEFLKGETQAEVEKKQMEMEFRRKERELEFQQQRKEMELEAQREEMELAEMRRQQSLSLKFKKLENKDQASSGAIISSASTSLRFRHGKTSSWVNSKENIFDSHLEDALDDEPAVYHYNEPPCSSKRTDAKLKGLETPNPSARSIDVKPKKSLKFDANAFTPSSAYAAAVKAVVPTPVPSSALPLSSAPEFAPAASVSKKFPNLVLDKFDGDPLE